MKIQLLNMQLRNFKGIASRDIEFGDVTTISGDNATGKTTIFDAFTWLLFGKNSGDAKEFNIKTLDAHNHPIHRLEHEVTALLEVEGRVMKLRRVFKEKWVKKRGSESAEFTGHETEFFIDDVPLSQSEYKGRVDMIISEEIAKLVTNPLYFNNMNWTQRRGVLEAIAGPVSDELLLDKIQKDGNFSNFSTVNALAAVLRSGKKVADYKREISAKKKLIRDALEAVPTRIDEAQRSRPQTLPNSRESIGAAIVEREASIRQIDSEIENKANAYQKQFDIIRNDQQKLSNLKLELQMLENAGKAEKAKALGEFDSQIRFVEHRIKSDQAMIETNKQELERNNNRITTLNLDNDIMRQQWNAENAKTLEIDEQKYSCPTCWQKLPEDQRTSIRETLTANFNTDKQKKLKEINEKGQENARKVEEIKSNNVSLETAITDLQSKVDHANLQLSQLIRDRETLVAKEVVEAPEAGALRQRITEFEANLTKAPEVDNTELKARKQKLSDELDALKMDMNARDQVIRLDNRINELEAEEKKLAQELADLERIEFTIDAYSKVKVEEVESRINGKFKLVRFKMFEQQINGGEVECCECMVQGVPYSDVNTASKINAGIDVINALTAHYQVNAPVWVDNRESVIKLLPCKSQIINLKAVKDAPLTVTCEDRTLVEAAA